MNRIDYAKEAADKFIDGLDDDILKQMEGIVRRSFQMGFLKGWRKALEDEKRELHGKEEGEGAGEQSPAGSCRVLCI